MQSSYSHCTPLVQSQHTISISLYLLDLLLRGHHFFPVANSLCLQLIDGLLNVGLVTVAEIVEQVLA